MSHLPRFAVVAMLVAACGGGGSSSGSADDGTYAIVDVNIVDVELGVTVRGQTVVVAGDRIERIGDSAELEVPGGADTIDGQGRYLMPGLVDAHVHFFDAPVFGRTMLANGVLLVRDMAMPTDEVVELRDELDSGALLGPEMRATGLVLDGDPPFFPELSLAVDTVEEGRAAVRQQADAGVDMIKVYTVLDADVFLAIVDEAETLGLNGQYRDPGVSGRCRERLLDRCQAPPTVRRLGAINSSTCVIVVSVGHRCPGSAAQRSR